MRDYGKISPTFWVGKTGKLLRGHPEAQIVALYLMTAPKSEMTGVFHCPVLYIAHETGLGFEGASKGLQRLIVEDFCSYDEDSETVFVHEMAKYQIAEELKPADNLVKSVRRAYVSIGAESLKAKFFERYKDAFHLTESAPKRRASDAPSKPLRSQEQEQEQEQEKEQEHSVANATASKLALVPPGKTPSEMTKDELWSAGKSLLMQGGTPEKQCGSFVGKLVKDYGNDIVIEAVRNAVVERPADPAAYLKACCLRGNSERRTGPPNRQEALERKNRAIADELAGETP